MILYDSRPANSSSPRMRRAKTPFARCPCTKPAICAAAVNHPHHINPMNHSSNKCQPALIHALIPVNPSIHRKKASSPACARPAPRRARPPPATPSAVIHPKFHAQSHIISRRTLIQLSYLPTHPTAAVKLPTWIPFETRSLRAHKATESWPSHLPLRNTHFAIRITQYPIQKKRVPAVDAHWICMPCPMRLQSKHIAIGFGPALTIRRPCTPWPGLRALLSLPLHTDDPLLSRPQPPERETGKNSISLFER